MHISSLLLWLSFGALVKCDTGGEWCYTGCLQSPSHWGDLPGSSCGAKRQSPINITTGSVKANSHLTNFTFLNFSSQHVIKSIENTGHTVKCKLMENEVEVSGGGLNGTYSTLQFHFHWGDTQHHPGSEHMVDGHRYPMEMHIVSLKKGLTVPEALEDSEGIAVLGFFINETEDGDMSGPWSKLTSYITSNDTVVNINHNFSIDDLIGNVDRTKFYRYMGSLTTPNCSEAVVWTVFQQPINVNKNLTQRFPMTAGYTHAFRPTQPLNGRDVYASPAIPLPPSHAWCYDNHCELKPSNWHNIPHSFCGGNRQSPVNIVTKSAQVDKSLDKFTFTKYGDKHAMKYIINTGHTVKAVLKDDMVEVSGGGLGYVYSTLQLHFHWGSASHDSEGSEHTVDSKRYPMEVHIVNKRKDLTLEKAVQTPNGLAVLGFFIEFERLTKQDKLYWKKLKAKETPKKTKSSANTQPTSTTDPWKILTDYFSAIKSINSKVDVTKEISIDDLLGDVDRTSYYRYNGSLTTPTCNEAVVWTVFKESVKVDQDMMTMFPAQAGYTNVYRPTQTLNSRTVLTTAACGAPVPATLLLLLLPCLSAFSFNLHP